MLKLTLYRRNVRNYQHKSKPATRFFFLIVLIMIEMTGFTVNSKKVVGYLPSSKAGAVSSINFCQITHLNICFANPDSNGKIQMANISGIINTARKKNPEIIICVSLGGGVLPENTKAYWSNLIDIPENRPEFISEIIRFVKVNQFDGVDFDLEWDAITAGYNDFAVQLNDSLKKYNKLFTAALPGVYRYPLLSDAVLQTFDFINIMAYDETGPWTPDHPGQHSSYEFAVRSVNFWKQQGIPSEKLVLGVPFYGYNFDNISNIFSFSYAKMVDTNALYADMDEVGKAYYNGRPTIKKKVDLASVQVGGIMIWELSQDRFDSYSLLLTIHQEFTNLGYNTTGLCGNLLSVVNAGQATINIYPVPVSDQLNIETDLTNLSGISLYNIFGQKLNFIAEYKFNKIVINLLRHYNGIYILKIENPDFTISKRIVIQH